MAAPKDGRAALMQAIKTGKAVALSLDDLRRDGWRAALPGKSFRIDYRDAENDPTTRWISVYEIDGTLLKAYCWLRRRSRSFYIDRILELVDADGEYMTGPDIFLWPRLPSEGEQADKAASEPAPTSFSAPHRPVWTPSPAKTRSKPKPDYNPLNEAIGVVVLWLIAIVGLGAWLLPVSKTLSLIFGLLFLLSGLWMVVGLIQPRLIQEAFGWTKTPTRGKLFAVTFGLMAALLTWGVATQPKPPPTAPVAAQAQSAQAAPVKAPTKGLGISRSELFPMLKEFGCTIAKADDVQGQDHVRGHRPRQQRKVHLL